MNNNNIHEDAQSIVADLAQGSFAIVEQRLAPAIRPALPAERLLAVWQGLEQQVGSFVTQVDVQTVQTAHGPFEVVTCAFERASLDINIAFNAAREITSLTATPAGTLLQQATMQYAAPAYANLDRLSEQEVVVGDGEWALPGTLTLPVGQGPFPSVVLVHGSGPQDRDETLPPNKPFRDLAWGLASQGIAVLRYEKRTKVHAVQAATLLNTLTVKEETIDDAVLAVALLRSRAEVDPQQIFVLGHSLGGYLAPRIGQADPSIAGLIILAGSARPLEDIILDQITYIMSLEGSDPTQQLTLLKKQVERVKDPGLSPATPASELPFQVPAAYWLDLRDYHPEQLARSLPQPILVLQAGSDYQVTQDDFQLWQAALGDRSNVQLKSYPGLHHLFMPVEGGAKATPAVYSIAGHVSEEVIHDIATWIKQH